MTPQSQQVSTEGTLLMNPCIARETQVDIPKALVHLHFSVAIGRANSTSWAFVSGANAGDTLSSYAP